MTQLKQTEWHKQWAMFRDEERFLFSDWIFPSKLEDFAGKQVLECGCGGGHHTAFIAPYARTITAVDLNTIDIAAAKNRGLHNVEFVEADIASMNLGRKYDVVLAIGVIHHTDDPDRTVANLRNHVKPGGRLIVWVYSEEGNSLALNVVEPVRKLFLRKLDRRAVASISEILTFLMYIPVWTVYLLPLGFLPYHEYFANFRKMSFGRNVLNVFDKLNAPQVQFISAGRIAGWFDRREFEDVHISAYKGVSWRGTGVLR